MADVLNAIAGDPAANTYATLVEARAYYANQVYATDPQLDDDALLTKALLMATQAIENGYVWYGFTSTAEQALAWPRYRMARPNQRNFWLDPTTIPQRLKDATSELARMLLVSDRTADNDVETAGIKSLDAAGTVKIEFTGQGGRKLFPDRVAEFLSLWGYQRNARGVARLVRG